jgi:mono/diheme cytochrome c family protein
MSRLLKILVGIVVVLVVLGVVVWGVAEFGSQSKLNRVVAFEATPVAAATTQEALERGKYLFNSRGCAECHGGDGAGKVMIDSGGFFVKTPNITPAAGSVVENFTDLDWTKVIRHGVKPNNHPLLVMPSEDYARYTNDDVAAIIGYVKSLPAADGTPAEFRMPFPVKLLYTIGLVRDAAEKIDHSLPPPEPVAPTDVLAHGAYVANACVGCHNPSLSGGKIEGGPPDWPPAANLTPGEGSVMPRYTNAAAFAEMFRTGKRPDGTAITDVMPFGMLKEFTDEDIAAVYSYLKTVTPLKFGEKKQGS